MRGWGAWGGDSQPSLSLWEPKLPRQGRGVFQAPSSAVWEEMIASPLKPQG